MFKSREQVHVNDHNIIEESTYLSSDEAEKNSCEF